MKIIYSEGHRGHEPPFEVIAGGQVPSYERPERAEAIERALRDAGVHEIAGSGGYGDGPIRAVHDDALIEHLATAWSDWVALGKEGPAVPDAFPLRDLLDGSQTVPAGIEGRLGYYCFDTGTAIVEGTYEAARGAVDVALTGASEILSGERFAFALCRPPGHHAGTSFHGGYSFFNNSAIAARSIQRETGNKVAIVDVDYHHGNGTQQIFWDDPAVLSISLHGDPDAEYPYFTGRSHETGGEEALGANLNLPLPPGTDGDAYISALEIALTVASGFHPSTIVIPFGGDTAAEDPLGTFELQPSDYRTIGQMFAATHLPALVVMEGGYDVDASARAVTELLAGLEDAVVE